MKTVIQTLCSGIFLGVALFISDTMSGQIDYLETFTTEEHRWTELDFHTTDVAVCDDNVAFRANPVNELGTVVPVETVSPSLGISNGEEVILTYNYKLLYYDAVLPYRAVDDPDWGNIILEYGPTINGPWTMIDAITPRDHIISDECMTREVFFTPEEGSEVYLRFIVGGGTNPDINYYVYIDGISALQSSLTIDSIVRNSDLKAYPNPVTDYLNLESDMLVTAVIVYNMQGQEVSVENIDNNFARLDMSGLAFGNYVLKVVSDDGIKTVNVQKK